MVRPLVLLLSLGLMACGHTDPSNPGADGGSASGSDDGRPAGDASNPGTCGTCNAPPTACHSVTGTCEGGVCEYAFVEDAPCNDGNACTVADTCTGGGCSGTPLVCNTPPANVCVSGTQLKAYNLVGSCTGGLCTYGSQTITCTSGCSNGACTTDPCANVTCNSPPSGCFSSPGTCQNGSCSYPYANGALCNDGNSCTSSDSCQSGVCLGVPQSCNSPPPNVCENASTLKLYSTSGSCSLGNCSYSYGFASCASGCSNGQCNATGWVVMTSNVTVGLTTVWASSATNAWAGGQNGTLVYYNGAQWQARSSGTVAEIMQIHGTASNNVFALAGTAQQTLLYYDGVSWSPAVAPLPIYYAYSIFALGPKDVLVYGPTTSTADSPHALLRYQNTGSGWQLTTLKQGTQFRRPNYGYRMWAESLTSIYLPGGNHWDGQNVTVLGPATYFGRGPGRMWKSGSLVIGQDWQNGSTPIYQYQSNAWTPMATGFIGDIEDFHGPSASRIFLVGYTSPPLAGHVLYYDGVGWTSMQLPPGVGRLRSVWALATGQVFAVGEAGLIITGP